MDSETAKGEYTQEQILHCLYDVTYTCPCCDALFTERAVNKDALKYCGQDTDMRMMYEPVDPLLYDVVCCTNCGYAALKPVFNTLAFDKTRLIAAHLAHRFKYKLFPQIYSYEIGVARYKAAIMASLIKREKSSEIAYLYMKLAWIFRSLGDKESENRMLLASTEGFIEATQKELYPFLTLNEQTALYITGDFLFRLGKNEAAKQFFGKILDNRDTTVRMKARIKEHPLMRL